MNSSNVPSAGASREVWTGVYMLNIPRLRSLRFWLHCNTCGSYKRIKNCLHRQSGANQKSSKPAVPAKARVHRSHAPVSKHYLDFTHTYILYCTRQVQLLCLKSRQPVCSVPSRTWLVDCGIMCHFIGSCSRYCVAVSLHRPKRAAIQVPDALSHCSESGIYSIHNTHSHNSSAVGMCHSYWGLSLEIAGQVPCRGMKGCVCWHDDRTISSSVAVHHCKFE